MRLSTIIQVALPSVAAALSFACTDATGELGGDGSSGAGNAPVAVSGGAGSVGGGSGSGAGGSGVGGAGVGGTGTGGASASGGSGSGGVAAGTAGAGGASGASGTLGGAGAPGSAGMSMASGGAAGRAGGGRSGGGAGGAPNGSAGRASSAGGAGTDPPPPTDPLPSPGCGSSAAPMPCNKSGTPCTMDVDGTEREYYVVLPDAYDASHPYPVVFQWHPLGGNAEQGMNMYQIRPKFPEAIYITPNGLLSGNNRGFPNTNGGDEAMTRAIIADVEAKYCIDKARYYSTGFSYGGSMSYTAACNMSDVFRAIGAMSGAPISGAKCSSKAPARPVAFWGTHGTEDTALPMDLALPIRDAFVTRNGCQSTTQAVDPSPCVAYDGCEDGYPVIWCQREGDGHAIPSFAAGAIAKFFMQF